MYTKINSHRFRTAGKINYIYRSKQYIEKYEK